MTQVYVEIFLLLGRIGMTDALHALILQAVTTWQELLIGFAIAGLGINTAALVSISSMRVKIKRLEESAELTDALHEAFVSHTGLTVRVNGKSFKTPGH